VRIWTLAVSTALIPPLRLKAHLGHACSGTMQQTAHQFQTTATRVTMDYLTKQANTLTLPSHHLFPLSLQHQPSQQGPACSGTTQRTVLPSACSLHSHKTDSRGRKRYRNPLFAHRARSHSHVTSVHIPPRPRLPLRQEWPQIPQLLVQRLQHQH
jgi:hypothetical protein